MRLMSAPISFLSFRLCCPGRRGQLLEDTSPEEACWITTPHWTTPIPNTPVFKIGSRLAAGMCEREEVSSWEEDSQHLKDLGSSWCFLGTDPMGFFCR